MTEREENLFLRSENAMLREKVALLTAQVTSLEEKLLLLLDKFERKGVKKTSRNSSLPPSSDIVPHTKSLREPSGRSVGGQVGHKGDTLKMTFSPDNFIELKSEFCERCGTLIAGEFHSLVSKRQVVDIPPIKPIYTEYRQYSCACPSCHHLQKPSFPTGINAPIQYSSSITAFVAYFSVYQYVPYKRLQQLFADVFNLPLSVGTLDNLLIKAREKAQPVYEQIKVEILQSAVIGSDETSCRVKGNNFWVWVWQNVRNTFIVTSENRGFATIEGHFKDGFTKGVLVSDRWAAQLKTVAKNHQLCTAHLMRECIFLKEAEKDTQNKNEFADGILGLIKKALKLRKTLIAQGEAADAVNQEAQLIEKQYNELLILTLNEKNKPQTTALQKSLLKNRECIFPFLYNLEIPPDNNASERAIRNIKVKQKISGQFKSGQDVFCILRSVIDTLIKRKLNILEMVNQMVMLQPE